MAQIDLFGIMVKPKEKVKKMKKREGYGLKCFKCSILLIKGEFNRVNTMPYCDECYGNIKQSEMEAEEAAMYDNCLICDALIEKGRKYCNYHAER